MKCIIIFIAKAGLLNKISSRLLKVSYCFWFRLDHSQQLLDSQVQGVSWQMRHHLYWLKAKQSRGSVSHIFIV